MRLFIRNYSSSNCIFAILKSFGCFFQIFAVLFFLMLFTLGVGSASSLTNAVITVIHDQFMHIEKKWITTAVCTIGFFSGLIYTTPGGLQMLDLVDHFGAGFVIYIMATLEMIGICWFYGLSNVVRDIEFMLSMKLSVYWKFCWGFFIPIVLIVMFIYNLVAGSPPAGLPDIALSKFATKCLAKVIIWSLVS